MARKAIIEGGKRDEIIDAALKLFLTKGYEGTSVRAIMTASKGEIGLFYYYFKSKDEVFDIVIERFIDSYKAGLDETFEKGVANPRGALIIFFEFVRNSAEDFRMKYNETLHWAVRRAIRDKALETIQPYLEKLIDILVADGMPKPSIDHHILSVIMTNGIVGAILRQSLEENVAEMPEMMKAVHLLLGSPQGAPEKVQNSFKER